MFVIFFSKYCETRLASFCPVRFCKRTEVLPRKVHHVCRVSKRPPLSAYKPSSRSTRGVHSARLTAIITCPLKTNCSTSFLVVLRQGGASPLSHLSIIIHAHDPCFHLSSNFLSLPLSLLFLLSSQNVLCSSFSVLTRYTDTLPISRPIFTRNKTLLRILRFQEAGVLSTRVYTSASRKTYPLAR